MQNWIQGPNKTMFYYSHDPSHYDITTVSHALVTGQLVIKGTASKKSSETSTLSSTLQPDSALGPEHVSLDCK